ncbi:MAG: KDO2-lipid IV(A) lauroyltransferase [Cocleimonas sp.]|jgi:KDO2-lipid IV(A) lauroyltransferase
MPLKFYHPRFWPTWLGVGILRLLILLPWSWQMAIGKAIGLLIYKTLSSRRKISCINLEIAFPDLDEKSLNDLNRQHFISMGQSSLESAIGWWGSEKTIKKHAHLEGLEHLKSSLEKDNIILLGAHFMCLEVGGRIMAQQMPMHVTYRPHQNELIEYLVAVQRDKKYGKAIPKRNIREMIKSVKSGAPTWYATDQNYRGKGSINVPFFGIDAPSNPGTSRLAKMTGAQIMPAICVRLNDPKDPRKGYLVKFLPPLDNFPSENLYEDTTRLNHIIEEFIKDYPEQYLWTHKRYKHYANENRDFYAEYLISKSNSHCQE